jgi:hypothetical protein
LLVYYDPPEEYVPGEREREFLEPKTPQRATTTIETADGETDAYDTCWPPRAGSSRA